MIVGPLLPPGTVPIVVAVVVAGATTRWIAPLSIRLLATLIQSTVATVAAVMVLPEYYFSTTSRRRDRDPPQFAYDYGAVIGSAARLANWVIGFCFFGMAKAIRAIPLVWVAVIAALIAIGWMLGLIPVWRE
jgi:hypothetical protein